MVWMVGFSLDWDWLVGGLLTFSRAQRMGDCNVVDFHSGAGRN